MSTPPREPIVHRLPGLIVTEREHAVPLDHARPERGTISVFTREVAAVGGEERPFLVFLQGGPGFEAIRPDIPVSGWMARALQDHRVLLLDQRGTGRSTPVGRSIPGATPEAQAEYLACFRADSIVRDAEWVRRELGVERWSVLGQSFGGFTAMTYLSIAPEGLATVYITGGLAPIGRPIDEIYAATYRRTAERNRDYFERYPEDRARLRELERVLAAEEIRLPSGDRLSIRRFRQVGLFLGASTGFESIHHLLELPYDSTAFAHDVAAAVGFERNPIYATLHEACYADGGISDWSAERVFPDEFRAEGWLTAEHLFPWMWEEYAGLREHAAAAQLLAGRSWPRLYDEAVLARNEVPVAATIYVNDPYVERAYAEETARAIRGLRPWITNEFEHNGLRASGERILDRLIKLARGEV